MPLKPHNYVDPSISRFHEGELGLSLYFRDNHLSYAIYSLEEKKILAFVLADLLQPDKLKSFVKSQELLQFDYPEVQVAFDNCPSTLVPHQVLQVSDPHEWAELNFPSTAEAFVFCEQLSDEISAISLFPEKKWNKAKAIWPQAKAVSPYAACWHAIQIESPKLKRYRHQAYLHLEKNHFDLFLLENQKLIFANTFFYKNTKEFLYFFLYALQRLAIDSGSTPLILGGSEAEQDPWPEILAQHMLSVSTRPENNPISILQNKAHLEHFILFHLHHAHH